MKGRKEEEEEKNNNKKYGERGGNEARQSLQRCRCTPRRCNFGLRMQPYKLSLNNRVRALQLISGGLCFAYPSRETHYYDPRLLSNAPHTREIELRIETPFSSSFSFPPFLPLLFFWILFIPRLRFIMCSLCVQRFLWRAFSMKMEDFFLCGACVAFLFWLCYCHGFG